MSEYQLESTMLNMDDDKHVTDVTNNYACNSYGASAMYILEQEVERIITEQKLWPG